MDGKSSKKMVCTRWCFTWILNMKYVRFIDKDWNSILYDNAYTYFSCSWFNGHIFKELWLNKYDMARKYISYKWFWCRPECNPKDTISLMKDVIKIAIKKWWSVKVDWEEYKHNDYIFDF